MEQLNLQRQLEKYCALALHMGMSDAKVISATDIILDPRVRMKCKYPRCGYYGSNGNCPPYAPGLEEMAACIARYDYAVFLMKRFPSRELLGGGKSDTGHAASGDTQCLMYETVSQVEAAAFHDGYVLSMGFANGPCKKAFCASVKCSAIQPGGTCRFPLKSRSSMEGAGMDVYRMARQAGWEVIPAGHRSQPEEVPYLTSLGLVLVG